jgi:hypothetical protein
LVSEPANKQVQVGCQQLDAKLLQKRNDLQSKVGCKARVNASKKEPMKGGQGRCLPNNMLTVTDGEGRIVLPSRNPGIVEQTLACLIKQAVTLSSPLVPGAQITRDLLHHHVSQRKGAQVTKGSSCLGVPPILQHDSRAFPNASCD